MEIILSGLLNNNMMRLNILKISFLLVLFPSCDSKDNPSPVVENGSITASLNGQPWNNAEVIFNKSKSFKFWLVATVSSKEGFAREHLSIKGISPLLQERQIITPSENLVRYTTFIDDGDAISSAYVLDTTALNNFIQITKYDSSKGEIEGIFNVSFTLDFDSKVEDYPQTLEFTDGKFTVKVEREWFE